MKYQEEVKQRWSNTKEYKEYVSRGNDNNDIMKIFEEFGTLMHLNPNDLEVLNIVRKLQDFITNNYYTCSNEVLYNLGQMYVSDERFKKNIDDAGGIGCSEFVKNAIEEYCKLK
jgi:beta-glucosidase/6-phospho-beta-glucosidase/beta-galactosidase